MFCPHCGQPVAEAATFCGACGKPLVEGVVAEREGYHVGQELVGFRRRAGGALLDGLLIGIVGSIIAAVLDIDQGLPGRPTALSFGIGTTYPVNTVLGLFYGVFCFAFGGTLGARATHVSIVTKDGDVPGWIRGTGRAFAWLLSALPLGLGFWWAIWDREKRTWHDHLAGTWVVRDE